MSFVSDLAIWEACQIEFAKLLLSTEKVITLEIAQWKFKLRDIKITTPEWEKTYEIKKDLKAQDTWNYVIETRCNWKASGIYTSTADYIVYNVKWEWRIQERWELILRLIDVEKRITKGGDWWRAEMYVLKCDTLPVLFNKIETNGQTWEENA